MKYMWGRSADEKFHTALYIAELGKKTLDKYDIQPNWIYSFTSGSAANMLRAAKEIQALLNHINDGNEEKDNHENGDIDDLFIDAILDEEMDDISDEPSSESQQFNKLNSCWTRLSDTSLKSILLTWLTWHKKKR